MQISDNIGQLNNNISTDPDISILRSQRTGDNIMSLKAGDVFEGLILRLDGENVLLSLSDGSKIYATAEKGVTLQEGASAFFQVRSALDGKISISILNGNSENNPVFRDALFSADLPLNDENIDLVDTLIRNNMPIDSMSLRSYSMILKNNPGLTAGDLNAMKGFGLDITPENARMYAMEKNSHETVTESFVSVFDDVFDSLGSMSDSDAGDLFFNIYDALSSGSEDTDSPATAADLTKDAFYADVKGSSISKGMDKESSLIDETNSPGPDIDLKSEKEVKTFLENKAGLLKSDDPKLLLKDIIDGLRGWNEKFGKLIKTKSFSDLIKRVIRQRYSIEPGELKSKDSLNEFYKKALLDSDTVSTVISKSMGEENRASSSLKNIHDNVTFMNRMNDTMTYVMIPLRLSDQYAGGELLIYNNAKKKSRINDGELTAFLHFDMKRLGPVDIYIRLKNKSLLTNMYIEDDISRNLLENHIEELKKRFISLGYNPEISVKNKRPEGIDRLITGEAEKKPLIRYTFDAKA